MDNMTAKVSCFSRAHHYKTNDSRIFSDSAAEALLGEDYERIAQSMIGGIGFFAPGFRGTSEEALKFIVCRQLAPSVLGRSAYCEAMLENEIRLGCKQYVLFAAGYDTYALRNSGKLSVFELDLPELLADKEERIARAGMKSDSVFVPCDLSQESWIKAILQKGFDPAVKSFGSLLGISYYLEKNDFKDLLKRISGIWTKGSALCFDYPTMLDSNVSVTNRKLAAGAGENMKARYGYGELEAILMECGFLIYEHMDHTEMTQRYFAEYNRDTGMKMAAPDGVGYVLAVKN